MLRHLIRATFALTVAVVQAAPAPAQAAGDAWCQTSPPASFCTAVRGARAEGWPAQSRSEVMARHGMVTSSQPLATQAGLDVLKHGGNAIDAAVATAGVLAVVEPMMVGIASDLFAMVYVAKDHKVYVLNSSGTAPSGATLKHLNELGYHWDAHNWGPASGMPTYGILAVTVPGTVWGWDAIERRFGKLSFKESLEAAARYADEGFPVSERIAHDWELPNALPLKGCCRDLDPDSVKTWYINGQPPRPGQLFRNNELAHTLRLLQQAGPDVFYRGEIARAIVAKSSALGGSMTLEDLASYHGEWVEPASSDYHGFKILELPPPSQSWASNEMLNLLEVCMPRWAPGQTLASLGPASPLYWHLMIEAKKLAYADLYQFNADPNFAPFPLQKLLSRSHAASLCDRVDAQHASVPGPPAAAEVTGDTIVLSAADAEGNMVSWVNSNFAGFGSGVTIPGYGFLLHNRGGLFTLDPKSPNVIAPHKRPFNTLAAGMVMQGADPFMTVTLMGGDMQAQGHAQLLVDILDLGANAQAAADIGRFRHSQVPNTLSLEAPLYDLMGSRLTALGHNVRSVNGEVVGGVQIIMRMPDGAGGSYYRSGSDFRKDGQAAGW